MSSTITYKGSTLITANNQTRTLLTRGTWLEDNITITDVTSGGSVTITDEANATGTTCVITTGQTPTPTPTPTPSGDIPLNTQLIDYTKCLTNKIINSGGEEEEMEWYYATDYTAIQSDMTFTYTVGYWTHIAFYDSTKTFINAIQVSSDGTVDPDNSNLGHGTLTSSKIPSNASYVRMSSTWYDDENLSLIRTA